MNTGARPDRISIVVYDGRFERVHYALAMAAAAAAIGIPATLFFTMQATAALAAPASDGVPAWRGMPVERGDGNGGIRDDAYRASGVATFEELLGSCIEMGVKFMVCEMGLRAAGLEGTRLRDDVPLEPGGLVTFLADASGTGALLLI